MGRMLWCAGQRFAYKGAFALGRATSLSGPDHTIHMHLEPLTGLSEGVRTVFAVARGSLNGVATRSVRFKC